MTKIYIQPVIIHYMLEQVVLNKIWHETGIFIDLKLLHFITFNARSEYIKNNLEMPPDFYGGVKLNFSYF